MYKSEKQHHEFENAFRCFHHQQVFHISRGDGNTACVVVLLLKAFPPTIKTQQTLVPSHLFCRAGSSVMRYGFSEVPGRPSGSHWASRCRARWSAALCPAAPLGGSASTEEAQGAAGSPRLQLGRSCVSGSRGLWSSCCCRSPCSLCTQLRRRNLQAGEEKINALETQNQQLCVNTAVVGGVRCLL